MSSNFILHVCHIEVYAVSEVLVHLVIVEDAQVEPLVFNAAGILCGGIHPYHPQYGQVEQHVVGALLVERQLETQHVVQESGFQTQLVVGHGSHFRLGLT